MKLPYLDYCEDDGGVTVYSDELWDYDDSGCYFRHDKIPKLIESLSKAYELGAVISQRIKEAKRKALVKAIAEAQQALEAFDNESRT